MTAKNTSKEEIKGFKAPDLSELMSQIISGGKRGERLVFVEYDPATRAYYDHVGLPRKEREAVKEKLASARDISKSCGTYFASLSRLSGMAPMLNGAFLENLPEMAKSLLKHHFGLDFKPNMNVSSGVKQLRFLVCIARSQTTNDSDWIWLSEHKPDELYDLFHWLIQRTPQPRGEGGAGSREAHNWRKVDNRWSKIKGFIELAGLEYVFSIRKAANVQHARINVFLETGEYVGQIVAFANTKDAVNDKLLQNAEIAATLIRRIIPAVRQARYMDAIQSGGEGGNLEHVIIRHLPTLIPVKEFYVRIVGGDTDADMRWDKFFVENAKIYHHKPADNVKDFFRNFSRASWDDSLELPKAIKEAISKYSSSALSDGFIEPAASEVVLAFSTVASSSSESGVAVLTIIDDEFFSSKIFSMDKDNSFDGTEIPSWSYKKSKGTYADRIFRKDLFTPGYFGEFWRRYLETQLSATLSVVLQPRYAFAKRVEGQKQKGKTYEDQYGKLFYSSSYLDVERKVRSETGILNIVFNTVANTLDRLTNPRDLPLGYHSIARVIFYDFFCPMWKELECEAGSEPAISDSEKPEYTALGSLVREALDFEETLRLDGGYREHFIHSYHVFLLGLFLMEQLELFSKTKEGKRKQLQTWFLISMYHDIAYPIQKMKDITEQYLKRLDPGNADRVGVGDNIGVDVTIGFGKLLASNLLGPRLKSITDAFVKALFEADLQKVDGNRRKELEKMADWLNKTKNGLNLATYKKGVMESFFQFCLRSAINTGEHGILSALRFDEAATRRRPINASLRKQVAVAILGHHMLDGSDEGKPKLDKRWHVIGTDLKFPENLSMSEVARAVGFEHPFFLYDLRWTEESGRVEKELIRCLTTLLILCDTLAQWGRSKEANDGNIVYLHEPAAANSNAKFVLCYPYITADKKVLEMGKYYRPQLLTITGNFKKQRLIDLTCNCTYNENNKPAESASSCGRCKNSFRNQDLIIDLDDDEVPLYDTIMNRNKGLQNEESAT